MRTGRGGPHPGIAMATAGSSGLGRKKRNPGLLDQMGQFFGGDKKKRSKVNRSRSWVSRTWSESPGPGLGLQEQVWVYISACWSRFWFCWVSSGLECSGGDPGGGASLTSITGGGAGQSCCCCWDPSAVLKEPLDLQGQGPPQLISLASAPPTGLLPGSRDLLAPAGLQPPPHPERSAAVLQEPGEFLQGEGGPRGPPSSTGEELPSSSSSSSAQLTPALLCCSSSSGFFSSS